MTEDLYSVFTEEDYETLIEAVDNLPNKGASGFMFKSMLSSVTSKDPNEAEKEVERLAKECETERLELSEKCAVLKAKLIVRKNALKGANKT